MSIISEHPNTYPILNNLQAEDRCPMIPPNPKNLIENNQILSEKSKKKLGRKRNGEPEGDHTDNSEDNQMKRIKSFAINKALILFLNTILDDTIFRKQKFYKVNYSLIIENLNRDKNLEFFNMRLYELLIYTVKEENQSGRVGLAKNKILVDEIMKNANEDDDIRKVLDITLQEWFEIFIKKKDIKELNLAKTPNFLDKDDFLYNLIQQKKDLSSYRTKFEDLLNKFQTWFEEKTARPSRGKKKSE
jgi:hypothetical protein